MDNLKVCLNDINWLTNFISYASSNQLFYHPRVNLLPLASTKKYVSRAVQSMQCRPMQ